MRVSADSLLARLGLIRPPIDGAPQVKSMDNLQSHDGPPPLHLRHKEPNELYPENEGHVRAFYTPNGFDHDSVHKEYRGWDSPKLPTRLHSHRAIVQLRKGQVHGTFSKKRKPASAAASDAKKARLESVDLDSPEDAAEEEDAAGDFIFVQLQAELCRIPRSY